jgi:hypothetical protein
MRWSERCFTIDDATETEETFIPRSNPPTSIGNITLLNQTKHKIIVIPKAIWFNSIVELRNEKWLHLLLGRNITISITVPSAHIQESGLRSTLILTVIIILPQAQHLLPLVTIIIICLQVSAQETGMSQVQPAFLRLNPVHHGGLSIAVSREGVHIVLPQPFIHRNLHRPRTSFPTFPLL